MTKLSLGWIILTIDVRHIVLQFHLIGKRGDRPYWDPEKRVMNSCSLHILLIVFKFYFFVCFCFPIRTQLALNFQLFLSLQNLLIPIIKRTLINDWKPLDIQRRYEVETLWNSNQTLYLSERDFVQTQPLVHILAFDWLPFF